MESMPSSCYIGDAYPYMQKHDPFIYYNDIRTDAARCNSHVVPFTQLSTDLSAGTVPNFGWITPNIFNDMNDYSIPNGHGWLGGVVPIILSAPPFQKCGVLFLTRDDGAAVAGR